MFDDINNDLFDFTVKEKQPVGVERTLLIGKYLVEDTLNLKTMINPFFR